VKWYLQPVAAIGAMHMAYQEVLRGRRVGVCEDCGRLSHADAELCLCGGKVDPNDPPEEVLDDASAAQEDTFERFWPRVGLFALEIGVAVAIIALSYQGIATGDFAIGFTSVLLAAAYGAIG